MEPQQPLQTIIGQASTDNLGLLDIHIAKNGTVIGTTQEHFCFNVIGLTQNTTYAFTVQRKRCGRAMGRRK